MKENRSILKVMKEQMWLFALFTPLLLLLLIGVTRWHADADAKRTNNHHRSTASWDTEISSVEVAKIVAKPLTELLAMEIYQDANNHVVNAEIVARVELEDVFRGEQSNRLFTIMHRRSSVQLQLAYFADSGLAL